MDSISRRQTRPMDLFQFHRTLVNDNRGQAAFRDAIFNGITAGDTVLDVGSGTGIHSLFACQAGASRVYSVERDPIISLALDIAGRNGFEERITFFHCGIQDVTLPERVDAMVLHMGLVDTIRIAASERARFLKDGGLIIPSAAELYGAPLYSDTAFSLVNSWGDASWGLDLSPLKHAASLRSHSIRITTDDLLSPAAHLGTLDFSTLTTSLFTANCQWRAMRSGTLHGLGIWYVERLVGCTSISTAPPCDLPINVWPNKYLPIQFPITVTTGDLISGTVELNTEDQPEPWQWSVSVIPNSA